MTPIIHRTCPPDRLHLSTETEEDPERRFHISLQYDLKDGVPPFTNTQADLKKLALSQ